MRILPLGAMLFVSSASIATPITYEFSGVMTHSDTSAPVDLGIGPGTPFSGKLIYDSEALGCRDVSATLRVCGAQDTSFWTVSFGTFTLTSMHPIMQIGPESALFLLGVNSISPSVFDSFIPLAQSDTYLSFSSGTSAGSLLDAPGAPSDLTQFDQVRWFENAFLRPVTQERDGYFWNFGGAITSFHPVPEPSMLALFVCGLLVVGMARKRAASSKFARQPTERL